MKLHGSSPSGEKNGSANYTGRDKPMIELNRTEAKVYHALKRGIRGGVELSYVVDLDMCYVNTVIKRLEKAGVVTIHGKGNSRTIKTINTPYKVIRRRHARYDTGEALA
jgi:hypothetical protein